MNVVNYTNLDKNSQHIFIGMDKSGYFAGMKTTKPLSLPQGLIGV